MAHLDLYEEVTQMLFESRDIVVEVKQTFHKHLHLSSVQKSSWQVQRQEHSHNSSSDCAIMNHKIVLSERRGAVVWPTLIFYMYMYLHVQPLKYIM